MRYETSESNFAPRPPLDQSYDRIRSNHPIKMCSEIIRLVDTSMSPRPEDREPIYNIYPAETQSAGAQRTSEMVTNCFQVWSLTQIARLQAVRIA